MEKNQNNGNNGIIGKGPKGIVWNNKSVLCLDIVWIIEVYKFVKMDGALHLRSVISLYIHYKSISNFFLKERIFRFSSFYSRDGEEKSELGMEWRLANQQFLPQGAMFPNRTECSSVLM